MKSAVPDISAGPIAGPSGGQSTAREETDAALIRRLRGGDSSAMTPLVARYHGRAYRMAHRIGGGDAEWAEDVCQEVFMRVYERIDAYAERAAFSTWFYRILINVCLDERRKRNRWFRFFNPFRTGASPEDAVERLPDRKGPEGVHDAAVGRRITEDARAAMMALPEKQRMALYLKVFEEWTLPEIAAAMGLAEGTVKSHLHRATRSMRRRLAGWIE